MRSEQTDYRQTDENLEGSRPARFLTGAAYVRVSTDDQTELSPDAQLREIKKAAGQDGCNIPNEYIFIEKRGISGRKAENRPEFQRMIATAKKTPAPFSRLYLWKFSRFARNQEESTFYKGILRKKCGIEIISVSEPVAQGMFGRLIETIIEWFDEYYSYNLSGEVTRGMTEKALREGYQTSPCLGYKAVGHGKPFVIEEEEYKTVESVFSLFALSGMDRTAIARTLNEQGLKTKRGNPFDQRAVSRILTNPFYNGTVNWNSISFQGSHEVRSSVADLYDSCQERLKREFRPPGRRSTSVCRHWASGLLKCPICGASLCLSKGSGSNAVFTCWKYAKGIHKESCSVSAAKAENLIFSSLQELLMLSSDLKPPLLEYVPASPKEDGFDRSSHLLLQLKRLDEKEKRIRTSYENGIDTMEEYGDSKERLQKERHNLLNSLSALSCDSRADSRVKNVYTILTDPTFDPSIKGNALRSILKRIVCDHRNGQFLFYYYL